MNMGGLVVLVSVKEESVRANPQDRRHTFILVHKLNPTPPHLHHISNLETSSAFDKVLTFAR